MVNYSPADLPVHFGPDLEKENDHIAWTQTSAKKPQQGDETGLDRIAARIPLLGLGLASSDQETATLKSSAALDWLQKSPSPGFLKPTGTCTPLLSPYLKELSSPSPGSSQASPLTISEPSSTREMVRPVRVVRKLASASPEHFKTPSADDVQEPKKSAQNKLLSRPKPCVRSVVRLRARRALTLQTVEKNMPFSGDQLSKRRSGCSKSVGDLNLSGARLQSVARANLSRSADWPASSAASIRKRADEESGYEVPRKSLRHEDQSRSWHSATACLAQLSLLDNERHVSFGKATLLGPGRLG